MEETHFSMMDGHNGWSSCGLMLPSCLCLMNHSLDIWMLDISCAIIFLEHPSDYASWYCDIGLSIEGGVLHGPLLLNVWWGYI